MDFRMKGEQHSPEQIIKKLRDVDAVIAIGNTPGQVAQAMEDRRGRSTAGGISTAA